MPLRDPSQTALCLYTWPKPGSCKTRAHRPRDPEKRAVLDRDTLDRCQSGPPQLLRSSLHIPIDTNHDWDEVARDPQLANHIVDRIPMLKAAKLNEVGATLPK